jgi:hypothetical protein
MNLNFDLKIDGLVKDKINITFGPYIPFSNFSNSPSSPSDFRSCKEERISKPESMNFKIYPIVLSPSFNLNTSPPLTENLFSFAISGSSPNTLVSGPVFTISPNFTTKTLGHIPKSGIEGSNILLEKSSLAPSPQENVKMPYFPIKSENLKSKNSVVSNFPIFKSSYFTPSPLFFSNPCYTFSKMNTTNKFDNKSTLPARKRYLPYHMNKTGNKLVLGSYTSNFVPRLSNGEISQMPLDQRKKYYHRLVCDNPECVHDKFV